MDKTEFPKIFISYSWSSEEKVLELAKRLCSDGVDVVLDKWDLKEGNDKYVFMEQCVTDPEIKKVLIICDKVYAEKLILEKVGLVTKRLSYPVRFTEKRNKKSLFQLFSSQMKME